MLLSASFENYLRVQASQDVRNNLSRCFVAHDQDLAPSLIGYYTLTSFALSKNDLPEPIKPKYLPYQFAPLTLLGRLAVDDRHAGKDYGKRLLADAVVRSLEASKVVASIALIVDYKDAKSKAFYLKYGFIELPLTNRLFLPMKSLGQLSGR
jgi:GNAT superfamily N-acetyltransferase